MAAGKVLVYLLRRDLRIADNPILHHLATSTDHGFTHLLPIYVFPSLQIEVSGFVKDGESLPYPEARSRVGKYWRCGPHRAKFLAQSVWDLKDSLERLSSGLLVRVGDVRDVLEHLLEAFGAAPAAPAVDAVWMTEELSSEEKHEQDAVAALCSESGVDFKLWPDEKYFVDDRDTGLVGYGDLPDIFTSYRKLQEPLRERPRAAMPPPEASSLPPFPAASWIPPQHHPFCVPQSLDDLEARLLEPLDDIVANPPLFPPGATSGHPFRGGETAALDRLRHLIESGAMTSYQTTRNGLLGLDFSTKLSGYLAFGSLSARRIHQELLGFEDGTDPSYEAADGFGKGENEGTAGVRFELLWRDYMRLCTAKFGTKLFSLAGFKQDASYDKKWKTADEKAATASQEPSAEKISSILERFLTGTTGMGLIDASQRELFLTGYTSNRARQNSASFLAKHLNIDWRYGAEWYEMQLIDYDVSSNWANWQYISGVGNDPRGDARIFNPVKQAFEYDKEGAYVRTWVPELAGLEKDENVFQVWTTDTSELEKLGLKDNMMATDPIKRIEFTVDRKPRGPRRPFSRRRGRGRARGQGQSGGRGQRGRGPGRNGSSSNVDADADADGNADAEGTAGQGSSDAANVVRSTSPPRGAPRGPRRGMYFRGRHSRFGGRAGRGGYNNSGARGRGYYEAQVEHPQGGYGPGGGIIVGYPAPMYYPQPPMYGPHPGMPTGMGPMI
ncbi:hypothetical protein RJ55_06030 [Drechmeria coniospora]|nr:hypothetical protein RJ55_06030 [Drechmeria coniospora]